MTSRFRSEVIYSRASLIQLFVLNNRQKVSELSSMGAPGSVSGPFIEDQCIMQTEAPNRGSIYNRREDQQSRRKAGNAVNMCGLS